MSEGHDWRRIIRLAFTKRHAEQQVDDELRFHVESLVERLVSEGRPEEDARREVFERFGSYSKTRTDMKRKAERRVVTHGWHIFLDSLRQNLRISLRTWARRPGFTAGAVLTIALGIGACTAVFSLVSSILLRPLPYSDPDRLVAVSERGQESGSSAFPWFTYPEFEHWRESQDVFESLAGYGGIGRILDYGQGADRLPGAVVSADLFPTLGVRPYLGRGFRTEEDEPGGEGVLILSHELWATRLHNDPNAVGQSITVDETPFTIIGIMPPEFAFPDPGVRFWLPMSNAVRDHDNHYLQMVARLPAGVAPETARARAAGLEHVGSGTFLDFSPLKEQVIGSDIQQLLAILTIAVGGVLFIACTNVASLLLSGFASRRSEINIRAALGAGRRRLARQLLTETTALSLFGATVGIGVAALLTRGLLWLSPSMFPRQEEIGIHLEVVVFSLTLALAVGLLIGVLPALKSARPNLVEGLGDGLRGITRGGREGRFRDLLVAAQIAVTFALIVGAGLLTNSFVRQWTNPSGFSAADRVLAVHLTLPGNDTGERTGRYATHQLQLDFFNNLIARLTADPAIRYATLSSRLPYSQGRAELPIQIEGLVVDAAVRNRARVLVIAPEYFSAMGVQILRGREFDDRDADPGNPAIIIDETLADRYFQGMEPLGRRIRFGANGSWLTVVGVVAATRHLSTTEDHVPQAFLNFAQGERGFAHHGMHLLVGTTSSPLTAAPAVRTILADLDPGVAISSLTPLKARIWASVGEARFLGVLVSFFGIAALILAVVGIYALVSHAVTTRTQEFGVRLALGAKPWDIIRQVVLRGLSLTGFGLAAGTLGAFWAVGWLQSLLFGVSPRDLPTFGTAFALIVGAAVLASLVPAFRATKLDPVRALGEE